ncbi:MAG: phospholipase D-like domain-containing protein, partial [Nanoarchaeota archaeon]
DENKNIEEDFFKVIATIPLRDFNFNNKDFAIEKIYPRIQRMLAEAKQEIFIVNPFFDEEGANKITPTLVAAARQGINIKLIVREANTSKKMQNSLKILKNALNNEKLLNKIEIREYFKKDENGQIYATHAKILLVDDHTCYFGSANITIPSFYYNFEVGCVFTGGEVHKLSLILAQLWVCSERI